jgi:hypothetical protein
LKGEDGVGVAAAAVLEVRRVLVASEEAGVATLAEAVAGTLGTGATLGATTPEATADAAVAADGVAIDELTGFGRTDTEGALAAVEDVLAIPELTGFGRIDTEGALGTAADALAIAELPGFG